MTRPTPAEIDEAVKWAHRTVIIAERLGEDGQRLTHLFAASALLAVVAERDEALAAVRDNFPETRKVVQQLTAERIAAWYGERAMAAMQGRDRDPDAARDLARVASEIRSGAWKGTSDADE